MNAEHILTRNRTIFSHHDVLLESYSELQGYARYGFASVNVGDVESLFDHICQNAYHQTATLHELDNTNANSDHASLNAHDTVLYSHGL